MQIFLGSFARRHTHVYQVTASLQGQSARAPLGVHGYVHIAYACSPTSTFESTSVAKRVSRFKYLAKFGCTSLAARSSKFWTTVQLVS